MRGLPRAERLDRQLLTFGQEGADVQRSAWYGLGMIAHRRGEAHLVQEALERSVQCAGQRGDVYPQLETMTGRARALPVMVSTAGVPCACTLLEEARSLAQ